MLGPTGGERSSLKAERDGRLFKQQLLRALQDPEVAVALRVAVMSAGEEELDDALDFDGNVDTIKQEDEEEYGAAPAAAAAAAPAPDAAADAAPQGAGSGLKRISSVDKTKTAARRAAWQASAAARMQQSGKTLDAISADAVGEIVNSHYTMTAWLLCPSHDALSHRMGKTIHYCAIGMIASVTQCLIVNALIADLIDKERWGNAADGLLSEVQGLRPGSSIIAREMQYCRDEESWKVSVVF